MWMISGRRLAMGMKGFGECDDELLRSRWGLVQRFRAILEWRIEVSGHEEYF